MKYMMFVIVSLGAITIMGCDGIKEAQQKNKERFNPTPVVHAQGNLVMVTTHGEEAEVHKAANASLSKWKKEHPQHSVVHVAIGTSGTGYTTAVTIIVTLDKNIEE